MAVATTSSRPDESAHSAKADAAFLVVDDVVKRFETPDGPITAVDHMSFTVAPGEFLAVIGPSGCGKSTLFNIIGGLIDGYEGKISVGGERVSGPYASIGMVFQEESTFPWRTVIENVAFPLEISGMKKSMRIERARHFIALVGLSGFENRYPAELSGGMRQRVAIARTLASEPKILLMDEPFASLDEQTRLLLGDKVLQIPSHYPQYHRGGAALGSYLGDDLPPRTTEADRGDQTPAPALLRYRVERSIRTLCGADLERFARGGEPGHA
jgi:NitT/TauT family transport system ATP-binding protein